MGLVKAHHVPADRLEQIDGCHHYAITDQEQVSGHSTLYRSFSVLHLIQDRNIQRRSEALGFGSPVGDNGCGRNHKGWSRLFLMKQKCQCLYGFPKAHVIGKTGSGTPAVKTHHPLVTLHLVITQCRAKTFRKYRRGLVSRLHTCEQVLESFIHLRMQTSVFAQHLCQGTYLNSRDTDASFPVSFAEFRNLSEMLL